MKLNTIKPAAGSKPTRLRVGRGIGSGLGKTCGRGMKGEGSRTGGKNRGPMFEGGQKPFWMRLPKRGFSNFVSQVVYTPIPLSVIIARVKGDEITNDVLCAAGLLAKGDLAKVTTGTDVALKRKLTVKVRATASAKATIEAAGGTLVG